MSLILLLAKRQQFKTEIEKYEEIVGYLKQIKDLRLDTESSKMSLAFLIENLKNKNPQRWLENLEKITEKINEIKKREGKIGVSWFLSELITKDYTEFLEKKEEETKDNFLKRKLRIMKEIQQKNLEFNRKAYQKGQPVSFGGVSMDYIPEWYRYKISENQN